MRRSEINSLLSRAKDFIARCGFHLPPFAFWTPEQWAGKGRECDEIRTNMLGWDVTDFGLGDFERTGLLLFTLRNGNLKEAANPKPYAEKLLISEESQVTPMHFHWSKVEDIINRAGGKLVIQLYGSTAEEAHDERSPVKVSVDAVVRTVDAGGEVVLGPGESITLVRGLYHKFWAQEGSGPVLIGEVSAVNDDRTDNRFRDEVGRFPSIEEDEPPLHLLCNEYPPAAGG